MSSPETSGRIDDLAADWAARVDRAPLSSQDQAELEAWLAEDIRHQGAYARARAVLMHFDKAKALGADFDPDAFQPPAKQQQPTRRIAFAVGGAAALAACVAAMIAGKLTLDAMDHTYVTAIGEVRRIPLPDGSAVTLNTDSKMVVEFTEARRTVRLLRGEALFDVAKNKQRPFIVRSDEASVQAVGTSFTVRRWTDAILEIAVSEGVVQIDRRAEGKREERRIGINTVAYIAPGAPIEAGAVDGEEIHRKLAWQQGKIAFRGETLAEAATEFSRYSDTPILISDPRVARRTVVGLFVATDPINFSQAVAESFGLVARVTEDGVRISVPPIKETLAKPKE